MIESQTRKFMLLDACVLIDYWKSEKSILKSFSTHLGELHVVTAVLDEVDDIHDSGDLTDMGVIIVRPELEDLLKAGSGLSQLSFPDRLCLLVAKREGFTCVTNDNILRKACKMERVDVIRGLKLLLMLFDRGKITLSEALEIAFKIQASNPMYITQKVINSFKSKLKERPGI
jgi:predicted nucleic acid-binding protein